MLEKGPFVIQCYDSFEGEYYNIHPVSEHTHDTLEQAEADAEAEWQKIRIDQTTDPEEDDYELQDEVYIVDLNGNREPYPLG